MFDFFIIIIIIPFLSLFFFPLIKDVGLLFESTHSNCNIERSKYCASLQINANAAWKRKHLTTIEDFSLY